MISSAEVPGILARAPRGREEAHVELATLLSLAEALDVRDSGSATHCQRVGRYSELIARELGLPPDSVERVRIAGILHDVGRVGVPDELLAKEGPLDEEEWHWVRSHPEIGARMLDTTDFGDIGEWILAHHERPDGTGYPDGRAAAEVPLEAAILGVADAYEAMTAVRPYRPPLDPAGGVGRAAPRAPGGSSTSVSWRPCCAWSEIESRAPRGTPLTTHALDNPTPSSQPGTGLTVLKNLDLGVLALALPVFLLGGFPMVAYAIVAVAWIAQRLLQSFATARAVETGDRRAAIGVIGGHDGRAHLAARPGRAGGGADRARGRRGRGSARRRAVHHLLRDPADREAARGGGPPMSTRTKVFIGLAVWFAFALILFAIFGSDGKNEEFQPQNEFKLDPWIELKLGPIDMSINKAVMYLFIAATLTTGTMIWIAAPHDHPPEQGPGRDRSGPTTGSARTSSGRTWTTRWRRSGSRSS